ncbi:terminase TerL endonuclease subunit [Hyphococcus sp.]|uniref:terminase TerL endonuclease subunit n=1 Tax=Hyphococcus sp. TaxID=2038636 RepID=UPI003753D435
MARPRKLTKRALHGLDDAGKAVRFLETLRIPEGRKAGEQLRLAPFQKQFIEGALAPQIDIGVLSVGRGNAKSALAAGVGLGALTGIWDSQPRRDVIICARTRDQAKVAWNFAEGLSRSLPDEIQARLKFRRSPRLEIEFEDDNGPHILRAIAADGKSALGSGPTLVIMDERGHWARDKGDSLEAALLTGLGKRQGRALIISTSAADDSHPFSQWIDQPPPRTYVQEHRPEPGLPADDLASLLQANPGARHGVGAPIEWLQQQAEIAIRRGGSALANFRLYHRNERVSGETRDVLLTLDQWLAAECEALPPREGSVIVGIDLGGSASMSAAALYWPDSDRLEVYGTFPSDPSLLDRGHSDGVGERYLQMFERGELTTLGAKTVPVAAWLGEVWRRIEGESVAAIVADRYKQAELSEAIQRAAITAPVIWRGMGFKDGSEDIERFRRHVFDGKVKASQSLLMRSAMADAVCLRDPANNMKLAKARSLGRIDAASASVLAVAEGARQSARPAQKPARLIWA